MSKLLTPYHVKIVDPMCCPLQQSLKVLLSMSSTRPSKVMQSVLRMYIIYIYIFQDWDKSKSKSIHIRHYCIATNMVWRVNSNLAAITAGNPGPHPNRLETLTCINHGFARKSSQLIGMFKVKIIYLSIYLSIYLCIHKCLMSQETMYDCQRADWSKLLKHLHAVIWAESWAHYQQIHCFKIMILSIENGRTPQFSETVTSSCWVSASSHPQQIRA